MSTASFKARFAALKGGWCAEAQTFCEELLSYIDEQDGRMDGLARQQKEVSERVEELQTRLGLNSTNSSIPPSKNPGGASHKPQAGSSRVKTKRKPGGQAGHKGHKAKFSEHPDEIVIHDVTTCPGCQADLSAVAPSSWVRKQHIELPPMQAVVTEHRIAVKTCCGCCKQVQAQSCPQTAELEFGPRLQAFALYLSCYQMLPQQRTKELFEAFGVSISSATLNNIRLRGGQHLQLFLTLLMQTLKHAKVLHADETGTRVNGKRQWIHVVCDTLHTLFVIHTKRGHEAHDYIGILGGYEGVLHHDRLSAYDRYACLHALCCAHLLGDLQGVVDTQYQKRWAKGMMRLLINMKKQVAKTASGVLSEAQRLRYARQYQRLVAKGLRHHPPKDKPPGKKGKVKQSKTCNLLLALQNRMDEVLRFTSNELAEFTNNLAERDLRMNKIRDKVSGGFRSIPAAEAYMHIRSFISTAKKQAVAPLEALYKLFTSDDSYLELAR